MVGHYHIMIDYETFCKIRDYQLYRKSASNPLLNPVLLAVLMLGGFLWLTDTPYEIDFEGAQFVHFLLGPATVALAIRGASPGGRPTAAYSMIERGVNNIITDEPSLLREVLVERVQLSDAASLLLSLSARLKE